MSRYTRYLPLLVIAFFVANAINYARVMPVFEAADEAAHFLYVHHLLATGDLPRINSREVVAEQTDPAQLWAIESHQPPLYYTVGTLLVSFTERDDVDDYLRSNSLIFTRGVTADNHNKWLHAPGDPDGDTATAVYVLRGYSIALGVVTLVLIYLTARLLFESRWPALLALLLTASIPTFVSISASVNNDNLVTMLYAAGVYWTLRLWQQHAIKRGDMIALSAVLSAIALTKLTGLSLFGIVFTGLLVGVWRGYFTRWRALVTAAATLGAAAVTAGWWYLRNWDLYGDPLALSATRSLWGREYEIAATSGVFGAELLRIAQSFWMMFGHLHLPVYGPGWVYFYTAGITVLGVVGLLLVRRRDRQQIAGLLVLVCGVVTVVLLIGTRSVDISYGRLLFPALVGFAPLLVLGWWRLLRRWSVLLVLPLVGLTVVTPAQTLMPAYPQIETVAAVPVAAEHIDAAVAEVGTLTLSAIAFEQSQVMFGERLRFDLYLSGAHPHNPALLVTVVDAVTQERLGHSEVYPGSAPTDALRDRAVYRAAVAVTLDERPSTPLDPRQILLRLDWLAPGDDDPLPLVDGGGAPLDLLLVGGPALIDPRYQVPAPDVPVEVIYTMPTAALELSGYTLDVTQVAPGESFDVDLHWSGGLASDDWILTVQLLDDDNVLAAQSDGVVEGYPTSRWVWDAPFVEQRTLTVREDAPPGEYRLLVGWYRQLEGAFVRMPPTGAGTFRDDLFVLPATITVR
jgi:hypothetical protein